MLRRSVKKVNSTAVNFSSLWQHEIVTAPTWFIVYIYVCCITSFLGVTYGLLLMQAPLAGIITMHSGHPIIRIFPATTTWLLATHMSSYIYGCYLAESIQSIRLQCVYVCLCLYVSVMLVWWWWCRGVCVCVCMCMCVWKACDSGTSLPPAYIAPSRASY